MNILLNNPNAQGRWNYDALAKLIPDIDYKSAGLTDADLNMIGVDYLLQTEGENALSSELSELMSPIDEMNEQEKIRRQTERAEKIQKMKAVKQDVKESAMKQAEDMDAYIMLSFDNFANKVDFCTKYGLDENQKFMKGEEFDRLIESIITE